MSCRHRWAQASISLLPFLTVLASSFLRVCVDHVEGQRWAISGDSHILTYRYIFFSHLLMGINFLPWVRRKLFLRLQVITDSRDYTGGRVDAFQRIIIMSGYSSFLTRNLVLNGPCLDRPASFSAILCSLSTFTVWRSIRPPGIPFTVLTTGWLDIRDSELKWMRLLQWPQEMCVLSVTPDLRQPLREPVVHEVIRGWQFQCVHVSPFSPTGYNCQVNINECASNPCLNQGTCFDDISGYTCHCALPYTGEYCRPAGQRGVSALYGAVRAPASQWLRSERPLWGLRA